jgi:hypothetical protein
LPPCFGTLNLAHQLDHLSDLPNVGAAYGKIVHLDVGQQRLELTLPEAGHGVGSAEQQQLGRFALQPLPRHEHVLRLGEVQRLGGARRVDAPARRLTRHQQPGERQQSPVKKHEGQRETRQLDDDVPH